MTRKDLLFLSLIGAATLGLLEMGMRAERFVAGAGKDPGFYPLIIPQSLVIPHPYAAYVLNPDREDHNLQGFRARKDRVYGKDPHALVIACLGESSTYGLRVPLEHSYPFELELQLSKALPGRKAEVINAGVPGYSTPNILAMLSLRVLPLKPDVVVLYAGFNDAWTRLLFPGFRDDYSHAQRSWVERPLPFWRHSLLLDRVAERLGHPNSLDPVFQNVAWNPRGGDPLDNWRNSSSEPFRRNLVSFIAIVRAHGAVPVLVTQGTRFEGHPEKEAQALPMAVEEHTAVLRKVAKELSVDLIDVRSQMSEKDEYFRDFIHMSVAGNRECARIVAEYLRKKVLPKLARRR